MLAMLERLFKKTSFKRRAFFFLSDIVLLTTAAYLSFWLRFEGKIPSHYVNSIKFYVLLALIVKISFLAFYGLFSISWRFFSLRELMNLFKAMTLASLSIGLVLFLLKPYSPFRGFPRSVLFIDFIISTGLISLLRISKRAILERTIGPELKSRGKIRTLIVGAGSAGEQIAREMFMNRNSKYFPIGYVDDDPAKKGIIIHGVKVLGSREDIPDILTTHRIDQVLIAIPSASSKEIRKIVEIIRNSNFASTVKILPGIANIIDGKVALSDIQEVKIEDLLGREPVDVNFNIIRDFLMGKRVLITGAAGSIGSERSKILGIARHR